MKAERLLKHDFVEFIPDQLKDDTIYGSIPYATVAHKCWCGCGMEAVTPLSPTGWTLIFDGESISLAPSIGNWSFDCKSNYWISRINPLSPSVLRLCRSLLCLPATFAVLSSAQTTRSGKPSGDTGSAVTSVTVTPNGATVIIGNNQQSK